MVEEGVGNTGWRRAYMFASLFCFMSTAGIVWHDYKAAFARGLPGYMAHKNYRAEPTAPFP